MIKLTATITEGHVYLQSDQVRAVYIDGDKTHVVVGTVAYPVAESPEEVARLITEAKHRKMQLQAAYMKTDHLIRNLEAEDMP